MPESVERHFQQAVFSLLYRVSFVAIRFRNLNARALLDMSKHRSTQVRQSHDLRCGWRERARYGQTTGLATNV